MSGDIEREPRDEDDDEFDERRLAAEDDLLDDESADDSTLGSRQYALGTLFFAVTLACIYFAVERYSGGRFALAAVLVLAVGMPLLYILAWASRFLLDAGIWGTLIWIASVAGLVALGLYLFYGMFT